MRNCQVCVHNGKRVILNDYDGTNLCLFECTNCGYRYVDALHLSQEWFDNFYLTRYTTNDKEMSGARLDSLAACMVGYGIKKALDIGGLDMELSKKLSERDVAATAAGVGFIETAIHFDAVVLSHTLEHIYDIGSMFERINSAIVPSGLLFIELPIHLEYTSPALYDKHWQHINKFRPQDIEVLFTKHGFKIVQSEQIADYWEYKCWRIIGRKA